MARGYTEPHEAGTRTGERRVLILFSALRGFHRKAYVHAHPALRRIFDPRFGKWVGHHPRAAGAGYVNREMSAEPGHNRAVPPLPAVLTNVWPFIGLGALGWLVAVAAAFLVPTLQSWRPVTLAGLGVGLLGTSIFVWQLTAARRGARGAQAGLENYLGRK
jgi:hypothetical protein